MKKSLQLTLTIFLFVFNTQTAFAIYKCTNDKGKVVYQKIPCQNGSTQKKMRNMKTKKTGVSNYKEFTEEEGKPTTPQNAMIFQAQLSSVLASLSNIKLMVLEHYHQSGVWPKTVDDIGLPASEMTSSQIDKITFDGEGGIIAHLNGSFGNKKKLAIKPKSIMGGTDFEWECFANFTKQSLTQGGRAICESRVIN